MSKKITDTVFDFEPFDDEEREIMASVEKGEWVSVLTPALKKEQEQMARNTLPEQEQPVYLHLERMEIKQLQIKADEKGISSGKLIQSIIHKYITGELVEKTV